MTKTITILAISTAILLGTLTTGNQAFAQILPIGSFGSQIYEVTGQGILREGETVSDSFDILCLNGDIMYAVFNGFTRYHTILTTLDSGTIFSGSGAFIFADSPPESGTSAPPIGFSFRGSIVTDDFEVPVPSPSEFIMEGKIICLSPSSIPDLGDVGGFFIQPDSTALFLAYGIANSVWLVPTLAVIGAGIYLTKSKWKR